MTLVVVKIVTLANEEWFKDYCSSSNTACGKKESYGLIRRVEIGLDIV